MSDGISIREFARRDGCAEGLVRRAIQQTRLAKLADGSLDPKLVGSGWRKTNRAALSAETCAHNKNGVRGAVRGAKVGRPTTEPTLATLAEFLEQLKTGAIPPQWQAEQVKENALAMKHLLDGLKKSGELVELSYVESVFFEVFRSARDAWLNFPARVGPLIAAELGVEAEKVVEALTTHVHQHLADLGDPEVEFSPDGPRAVDSGGSARVDAAATDQHPGVG